MSQHDFDSTIYRKHKSLVRYCIRKTNVKILWARHLNHSYLQALPSSSTYYTQLSFIMLTNLLR